MARFVSFDDKGFIARHSSTIGATPTDDEGVEQWIVSAIRHELKQRPQQR